MMHSSGSKNPYLHICTGELKYTINRSTFITGGTTGMCRWYARVLGNLG